MGIYRQLRWLPSSWLLGLLPVCRPTNSYHGRRIYFPYLPTLFRYVIQPVEHDLVLKALAVDSAMSLAALLRRDDVLCFGTGQLVIELLTVNSQLSLALSADIEIRAGELVLQTPQVVLAQPVDEFCDRSAARTVSITYVSLGDKPARHGRQIDFALKISGARLIHRQPEYFQNIILPVRQGRARDAGLYSLLKSGCPRRKVPAQAPADQREAFRIDIRASEHPVANIFQWNLRVRSEEQLGTGIRIHRTALPRNLVLQCASRRTRRRTR